MPGMKRMRIRCLWKSCAGSVMLEYILLNFWLMAVLVLAGVFFVNPNDMGGKPTYRVDILTGKITETEVTTKRFGLLGDGFLQHFSRVMKVISMPYP